MLVGVESGDELARLKSENIMLDFLGCNVYMPSRSRKHIGAESRLLQERGC